MRPSKLKSTSTKSCLIHFICASLTGWRVVNFAAAICGGTGRGKRTFVVVFENACAGGVATTTTTRRNGTAEIFFADVDDFGDICNRPCSQPRRARKGERPRHVEDRPPRRENLAQD